MKCHFILFVTEQASAAAFFAHVLQKAPALDEDGMTEFRLGEDAVLGLMPRTGINRLLGLDAASPGGGCELYLYVDEPGDYHARAVEVGVGQLSPLEARSWGTKRLTASLLMAPSWPSLGACQAAIAGRVDSSDQP